MILNLPRAIRFKCENVILFDVIPGHSEPSLTINSYLSPLVSDFKELWTRVKFDLPGMTKKTTIRCALLGVACDLPAARKTGGFLSYTANLIFLGAFKISLVDMANETIIQISTVIIGKLVLILSIDLM